ncbi:unnamed protein product [Brassica oleracea]
METAFVYERVGLHSPSFLRVIHTFSDQSNNLVPKIVQHSNPRRLCARASRVSVKHNNNHNVH